jgi:hypothetical protein
MKRGLPSPSSSASETEPKPRWSPVAKRTLPPFQEVEGGTNRTLIPTVKHSDDAFTAKPAFVKFRPLLRILLLVSIGIFLALSGLLLFWWPAPNFSSVPILSTADLSSFSGIHRLVIVFPGDAKKEEAFYQQWQEPPVSKRMAYRSLLLYRVVDPKVIGQLRSRFAPGETGFRIWLVGTGGGLLFTTPDDVAPWEIFTRIDSLPGRRDEIRRYNDWRAGHRENP